MPSAAAVPTSADRQPRVKPIAITMVVASTISTTQATKVAMTTPHTSAPTLLPFVCPVCIGADVPAGWVARQQERLEGLGRHLWPRLSDDVHSRSLVAGR